MPATAPPLFPATMALPSATVACQTDTVSSRTGTRSRVLDVQPRQSALEAVRRIDSLPDDSTLSHSPSVPL